VEFPALADHDRFPMIRQDLAGFAADGGEVNAEGESLQVPKVLNTYQFLS
jgi:hypothetical protein